MSDDYVSWSWCVMVSEVDEATGSPLSLDPDTSEHRYDMSTLLKLTIGYAQSDCLGFLGDHPRNRRLKGRQAGVLSCSVNPSSSVV